MRPGFVLAELTTKLSLTPEQQKTVAKVIADGRAQLKDLRGDDSIPQADKRAKMREIMVSTRGQIRAALTPDQQKLFDAMPANQGKGAPEASAPAAPPAQP
jgi:Spy/CpxP family protein refolding chaperone